MSDEAKICKQREYSYSYTPNRKVKEGDMRNNMCWNLEQNSVGVTRWFRQQMWRVQEKGEADNLKTTKCQCNLESITV